MRAFAMAAATSWNSLSSRDRYNKIRDSSSLGRLMISHIACVDWRLAH